MVLRLSYRAILRHRSFDIALTRFTRGMSGYKTLSC